MTHPVMYFFINGPLVHLWLGKYDEVTVMARIGGWVYVLRVYYL